MAKPSKNKKRYPYRVVEGIENCLLDACLLFSVPKALLIHDLKTQPKLLKEAGISMNQVIHGAITQHELIQKLSGNLYGHYLYWNHLVTNWYDNGGLTSILTKAEGLGKFETGPDLLEEWASKGQLLVDDKKVSVCEVVNVFRFFNYPQLHPLVKPFLEENAVKYYIETGIKLGDGFDLGEINWDIIDEALESEEEDPEEEVQVKTVYEESKTNAEDLGQLLAQVNPKELGTLEQGIDFAIDVLRMIRNEKNSDSKVLKDRIEELTKELHAEKETVRRLTEERKTLDENLSVVANEYAQLQEEVKSLTQSHESALKKLVKKHEAELKSKNKEHEAELKAAKKELRSLNKEYEELKKKYEELKGAYVNPEVAVGKESESGSTGHSIEDFIYTEPTGQNEESFKDDETDFDDLDLSSVLDKHFDFKPED